MAVPADKADLPSLLWETLFRDHVSEHLKVRYNRFKAKVFDPKLLEFR